jgi:hypothetical protein
MFASHILRDSPSGLFLSRVPSQILYAILIFPMRAAPSMTFYHLNKICQTEHAIYLNFSLTFSPLGPNILLSTLLQTPPNLYLSFGGGG